MIAERLLFLGADLAAAHFLVHRGASVKFVGDENWYRRDKKKVSSSSFSGLSDLLILSFIAPVVEYVAFWFCSIHSTISLQGYSLPGRKVPGLHIEAIDASGTELMYEGR